MALIFGAHRNRQPSSETFDTGESMVLRAWLSRDPTPLMLLVCYFSDRTAEYNE
jgi:hypothetical protein